MTLTQEQNRFPEYWGVRKFKLTDEQKKTLAAIREGRKADVFKIEDMQEFHPDSVEVVLDGGKGCGCVAIIEPNGKETWMC